LAARECYLRVVMAIDGVEYIAGLEFRPGDKLGELRTKLKVRMKNASVGLMPGRWADVAFAIEKSLKAHWPDRAYFIEVGSEREGWIQLFQPWGLPRDAG